MGDSPTALISLGDHDVVMTSLRHHLVETTTAGYYLCMSRCVRRAFFCGDDRVSGQSFEHRKAWFADRATELASIFAVGLVTYAVLRNHMHLVLTLDALAIDQWSDTEVAERWMSNGRLQRGTSVENCGYVEQEGG